MAGSPPSTPPTSSSPTVAATSGRGSTAPEAYSAIVSSSPGEADRIPTAVMSRSTSSRVSSRLGTLASPM
jgi:hypothetical protein